jgi:CRP-like cAMP-binding protein
MLMADPSLQSDNQLLNRLPKAAFQRILPLLQPFPLKVREFLYKTTELIDYVYFPASGIISAMRTMEDGSAIEVATIGNEGMADLSAFTGGESSPYDVMVQVGGEGWRMSVDVLRQAVQRESALKKTLALYSTAYAVQVSYSVACNGLHTVDKRCCRWLLMTLDRVGHNRLLLTHEFLAIMLGVRRASVTDVLRPLQDSGVIRNDRGTIEILDRKELELRSCECYRHVRNQFARLFD